MKHNSRNTIPAPGKNSAAPPQDKRRLEGLGEDEQSQMLRKDSKQMNKLSKRNPPRGNRSS